MSPKRGKCLNRVIRFDLTVRRHFWSTPINRTLSVSVGMSGNAACDLDEKRALELVAAMGWIKSRETYARFMMKRFVGFLAERGVTRERQFCRPAARAMTARWRINSVPTPCP